MRMELFSIGPFTIYSYGLMIAVGILVCIAMGMYRAKKRGMSDDAVLTIAIIGVLSGFIGAKLLYVIVEFDQFIEDPMSVMGGEGFVVYGGIIGGVLAGYVVCRIKKEKFWQYFDLIAPAIALAQGFGRIGCLLAGCCYGKETDSPLSITFHTSDFAPNDVALIPTQIYSSILDFLNCIVLCLIARYAKKERTVSGCYLIFYSTGRFILEFFRGDLERGSVGVLSTSQFISIFIFAIGAAILFTGKKKALVMK